MTAIQIRGWVSRVPLMMALAYLSLVPGACSDRITQVESGDPGLSFDGPTSLVENGKHPLFLVNENSRIAVYRLDGEVAAKVTTVSVPGAIRAVTGAVSSGGRTLELVIDSCTHGLAEDPAWKLACAGEAVLSRVAIAADTWKASKPRVFGSSTDGATAQIAPHTMGLGRLGESLLLSIPGQSSWLLGPSSETPRPSGCSDGATIYQFGDTATPPLTSYGPDVSVPAEGVTQIERFDSAGAPIPPLELPPATAHAGDAVTVACTSGSLDLLSTTLGAAADVSADNTQLWRFDGHEWAGEAAWTGNLAQFTTPTTTAESISITSVARTGDSDDRVRTYIDPDGAEHQWMVGSQQSGESVLVAGAPNPALLVGNQENTKFTLMQEAA